MKTTRVDAQPFPGKTVVGNTGRGVKAGQLPRLGTNGGAAILKALDLRTDTNKEVRATVVTYPSAGTFSMDESFRITFTAPTPGRYSATLQTYLDGADNGQVIVDLIVGGFQANGNWALPSN